LLNLREKQGTNVEDTDASLTSEIWERSRWWQRKTRDSAAEAADSSDLDSDTFCITHRLQYHGHVGVGEGAVSQLYSTEWMDAPTTITEIHADTPGNYGIIVPIFKKFSRKCFFHHYIE